MKKPTKQTVIKAVCIALPTAAAAVAAIVFAPKITQKARAIPHERSIALRKKRYATR